jgi:hypothetical protein
MYVFTGYDVRTSLGKRFGCCPTNASGSSGHKHYLPNKTVLIRHICFPLSFVTRAAFPFSSAVFTKQNHSVEILSLTQAVESAAS